jgi:hypothetical protein
MCGNAGISRATASQAQRESGKSSKTHLEKPFTGSPVSTFAFRLTQRLITDIM